MSHPKPQLSKKQRIIMKGIAITHLLIGLMMGLIALMGYFIYEEVSQGGISGPQGIAGGIISFVLMGIGIPFAIVFILSGAFLIPKKKVFGLWFSYLSNSLWILLNAGLIYLDIDSKQILSRFFAIPSILFSGFVIYYLITIHRSGLLR